MAASYFGCQSLVLSNFWYSVQLVTKRHKRPMRDILI
jgi:hypothetical protein